MNLCVLNCVETFDTDIVWWHRKTIHLWISAVTAVLANVFSPVSSYGLHWPKRSAAIAVYWHSMNQPRISINWTSKHSAVHSMILSPNAKIKATSCWLLSLTMKHSSMLWDGLTTIIACTVILMENRVHNDFATIKMLRLIMNKWAEWNEKPRAQYFFFFAPSFPNHSFTINLIIWNTMSFHYHYIHLRQ